MPANPFSQGLSVEVGGDASGATRALNNVQGSLLSTRKMAVGAGAALAGALAAKGIGSAISAAGDFSSAMQESLAIMGDVSDAMRTDMSEAAREVANNTTFSATEAADSYFYLASAGLDAKESIEALPEVAAFAQAGMFDMATATDLLTDSASALGMEVDEYNDLADQLVKANTLANASVEQFASSLTRQAATSMRNANIATEEGIAVLAAWADQGIKGERAGNLFRRTIDQLQEAALKNADAFESFGISIFDAEGDLRNMADITEDMEAAFDGMSAEARAAALDQLGFSVRTREGILALMGNSEALREYQTELGNAGGTTEEVADKQLESFNSKMEIFKSRVNDAKIAIGNQLLPAANDLLDVFLGGDGLNESVGTFLNDVLTEENQQSISDITDELKEFRTPLEDNARESLRFAENFLILAQESLPKAEPALQDTAFILETIADALRVINDLIEKGIALWNKIPEPLRDFNRAAMLHASTGGASTFIRGAREAQEGAFDSEGRLGFGARQLPTGEIGPAGTFDPSNMTIEVVVEGDTDVVRNVTTETIQQEARRSNRRGVRGVRTGF